MKRGAIWQLLDQIHCDIFVAHNVNFSEKLCLCKGGAVFALLYNEWRNLINANDAFAAYDFADEPGSLLLAADETQYLVSFI